MRSLFLRSGNKDTMVLDPSGNVGIGTIISSARLDVVGNTEINGDLSAWGIVKAGYYFVGADNNGDADPDCWLQGVTGAGSEWGGNPYSRGSPEWQLWCVNTSLIHTSIPNGIIMKWIDTGLSGEDNSGHTDTGSDKLQVEVWYVETLRQLF